MKVIAMQSRSQLLISASVKELRQITGYDADEFEKAFGVELRFGEGLESTEESQIKVINVQDYPVSKVYQEARETLSAYEDLRGKFESIRNQISVLMQKMVAARPAKEAKKQ